MLFTLVSCDPPYIFLVKNTAGEKINFIVETRDRIEFDSLSYSDTLIPDEKMSLNSIADHLNKKLKIEQIDIQTYSFSLMPSHTVLISPSYIGHPIKEITFKIGNKEYVALSETGETNPSLVIKRKQLATLIVEIK